MAIIATLFKDLILNLKFMGPKKKSAGLAQSVEHLPCKQAVEGSSPSLSYSGPEIKLFKEDVLVVLERNKHLFNKEGNTWES